MDWEFCTAEQGNIAMTGQVGLPNTGEFTIGIACGGSYQSTAAKLLQSLTEPFESHRKGYVRQWQRAVINPKFDFSDHTGDGGALYRLSRCILLAHEDKVFQGALVASMSIPWVRPKEITTWVDIIWSGRETWSRAQRPSWRPARPPPRSEP